MGVFFLIKGAAPNKKLMGMVPVSWAYLPLLIRLLKPKIGDIIGSLLLLTISLAYSPLVVYFCSLQAMKILKISEIVVLWAAIYGGCILLYWLGLRKEVLAQNPLYGLLLAPTRRLRKRKGLRILGLSVEW
jgi:hypothetical protein